MELGTSWKESFIKTYIALFHDIFYFLDDVCSFLKGGILIVKTTDPFQSLIIHLLFEKQDDTYKERERSSVFWFTSQMPARASAGPVQRQESGLGSGSPTG